MDFFQNSLLPAMFRAELGVGLVGPGDGAPFGAIGFAGGGVTATDRGILAIAGVAREFYAKFVAVYGVSMVAIGADGVDQRWGSLGTPCFADRRRNPAKGGHLRSGFKKPIWVVANLVLFRRKEGGHGGAEVPGVHGGLGVRRIGSDGGQKWLDPRRR